VSEDKACYRKLNKYKYQLVSDCVIHIDIRPEKDVEAPFIRLSTDGSLTIRQHYAWDGPSGPTIDTRTFMRGSLVHDALYQLMRMSKLDHRIHRESADRLLKAMCLRDGMNPFRAWYTYHGVRRFGAKSALPESLQAPSEICVL
jgi:hypothetical protein